MSITAEQIAFDQQHIWHPYSSMINPPPAYPVESAEGVRIRLADGRELIDGMGSWWSVIHGYGHPVLNAAAHQQIDKMSHVMFGGLTHQPAIELARALVEMTPEKLDKVFLADSGSVAVEVAIKMAIQYWHARGLAEKHKLITIRNGYHGDTFGAMAVCDPVNGMHEIFTGVLPQQLFAPAPQIGFDQPWDEADIEPLAQLLADNHQQIAALILEPIVQGAGGMRFYSPSYLKRARELCDNHQVLLIADEIATGFGRTGELFACQHAGITPDILCVGKALTGGYMTLAATLTNSHIGETISAGGAGCFMHGPTFMGNPLACAVAGASLKLLRDSDWQGRVRCIEQGLKQGLAAAAELDSVAEVRCLGAIGVVEMKAPVDTVEIQKLFIERGLWIRPFGKLVYVMPPYVISDADLQLLTDGMVSALQAYRG
ncbi:adenosylmethionine--8-amino-7-oxononanoate transaminase [Marinobacterium arenosum]|uniref:adenosylmethionine--8-amino-7-oxononanoate transaminase n=1 Tax=Marinobacterium arenosum TaxID=2862496 RepID=UPI001C95DDAC|nr:adenosylmethionine--8-amino-7-oxononanoate transaminase [Marinobacterium arenosum]MBY4678543.1 adenosylmethionine--8-amino-7-oxononanoate transaminase [Marinobacterium arenosum]